MLGDLFYAAVRTSVEHNNLNGAIAGFNRYPFANSEHAVHAATDALRYLIARGQLTAARRLRDALPRPAGKQANAFDDSELNELLAVLAEDPDHLARALGHVPSYRT